MVGARALGFRLLVALLWWSHAGDVAAAVCARTVFGQATLTPESGRFVTADVNADGRLDFIDLAPGFGRLGVHLSLGDGTFADPLISVVADFVEAFTVADFDGDGKPDLVTSTFQHLEFFQGNGDGTFQARADLVLPDFSDPTSLAVADLDADGKLDLLGGVGGKIVFFRGKGNGAFFAAIPAAPVAMPAHLAVAKVDGDEFPDLVLPNGGSVEIRLGNGDGTFGDPNLYAAGANVVSVAAADFDLDGTTDVVAAVTGKVAFLKGLGDGSFLASVEYDAGSGPADVVAADFDGDGEPDVAVSGTGDYPPSTGAGVSILYGNGQGGFEDRRGYYAPVPARLVAGDFDGDGTPDIASFSDCCFGTVAVLLNLEARAFQAVRNVETAGPADFLVSGDFDGDGRLDLVAGDATGVQMLLGEDGAQFRAGISILPDNEQFTSLAVADFDGDGKLDLAIGGSFDFVVYLGKGDGTFREPIAQSLADFPSGAIQAADFDHDGKPDVAVTWGSGGPAQIQVFRGLGDGTFVGGPTSQPLDFLPTSLTAADLNGDGIADLVACAPSLYQTSDHVWLLVSNGDGSLAPPVELVTGDNPSGAAVGDFDEDGAPDLLVSNAGSGNVSLFFGNGDGSFAPAVQIGTASYPNRILVADFDGDGHADFAATASGAVVVCLGLGHGGFRSPRLFLVPSDTIPAVVGDFDRTGSLDLAVGTTPRSVAVLLNTTRTVSPPSSQTVCGGADAVFAVRASGFGPLRYQWRKDGVPLSDGGNISGSRLAQLRVGAPGPADEGTYDVVVTDACGSTTSESGVLTLAAKPPAPAITAPASVPPGTGGLVASVVGAPGHSYSWSITGGTLTAGQGTSSIAFTAGPAGTTMSLRVTDALDAGCVSDPAETLVQTDFLDVPPSHLFHEAIIVVAREGITAGCGGGRYCPSLPVSRAEMSAFILRGEHGGSYQPPAATGTVFGDVSTTTFLARWIEQLASERVSTGCGGGNFCPQDPVNRAAIAVFLLRGKHGAAFHPPPATGTMFADVSMSTFLADWIEQLAGENISKGCGGGNYCPGATVSRGEMAALIRRTFGL